MKKSSRFAISCLLMIQFFQIDAFAHGEEKPGPHGGFVRMPGAFHTEVVKDKKGYRIYLLDINWQNPSVREASVSASIEFKKKITKLSCSKQTDFFLCQSKSLDAGTLNITSTREGQVGGVSTYSLPLKFETPMNEMPEHSGH